MNDQDGNDDVTIVKTIPSVPRMNKHVASPSSHARARDVYFTVEYKDQNVTIQMLDTDTVGLLRTKITEKLRVQRGRQRFTNWITKNYDDQTVLSDLHLPRDNTIHLISAASTVINSTNHTSSSSSSPPSNAAPSRVMRTSHASSTKTTTSASQSNFPITVRYEEKPGKYLPYELLLSTTTTVGELKQEMERVLHVPVQQQNWTGLSNTRDSDQLQQTSIQQKAMLTLRRIQPSPQKATTITPKSKVQLAAAAADHSEDDIMEIDSPNNTKPCINDDITDVSPPHLRATSYATGSTRELLIPEHCTDDTIGLENFTRVFHLRYGSTGPILYIGGLDQAIHEALYTSIRDRRPLAVYLHHDRSICANVFCTQVLATETIVEYLANNYVVWAWDFTSDTNRTRFIESFKRSVSSQYSQRIAAMEKDAFPLILILLRSRISLEIADIIEGKNTPTEVLLSLMQSHDAFLQQRQRDLEEDTARETRERLKREQEEEYNQSLQADRAKVEARLADERKQAEEKHASEKLEQKRMREQRECKARLPIEPSETENNVTKFKIRLPDGQGILMRRFHINDTLQTLFDYLSSEGRMFGEYKLITTYPKRDLTTLKCSDTFEYLKLYPQEQLILESL